MQQQDKGWPVNVKMVQICLNSWNKHVLGIALAERKTQEIQRANEQTGANDSNIVWLSFLCHRRKMDNLQVHIEHYGMMY